jgi:hypothetical protein
MRAAEITESITLSKDAGIYAWIKREEGNGHIYQEVDGFWVWAPQGTQGFLNEYALGEMIDYLRARNAPWQWQIDHDPAIAGTPDAKTGDDHD